jgi:hypothetical protein
VIERRKREGEEKREIKKYSEHLICDRMTHKFE